MSYVPLKKRRSSSAGNSGGNPTSKRSKLGAETTMAYDGDKINSRMSGSNSWTAQPKDEAPEGDIPWSELVTPFTDLFWDRWSPIEHSLHEIYELLGDGASQFEAVPPSVDGEDEMEYQRWDDEYKKRTGSRYPDPPDCMAQELSSWLFEHPNEPIFGLLERFREPETVIEELETGGHMPALYGCLDKEKFSAEWPALRHRVKSFKAALRTHDAEKFDFSTDTESEDQGRACDRGSKADGGASSRVASTVLPNSKDGIPESSRDGT